MQQTENATNGTSSLAKSINGAIKKQVKRQLPALPSVAAASEMADVSYPCKVDSSPISWEALPLYSFFSSSADGSYPMIKVTKCKAVDIRTAKSMLVGSGRCYRVVF